MKTNLFLCISTALIISPFSIDARTAMNERQNNTLKELKNMKEYESARSLSRPTVIVFNAPECEYCKKMEPALEAAAKEYPQASIYTLNAKADAFAKNDAFKALRKEHKITGYPITFFLKRGTKPRIERGGMSDEEVDSFIYELVYGKQKPQPKQKAKAA